MSAPASRPPTTSTRSRRRSPRRAACSTSTTTPSCSRARALMKSTPQGRTAFIQADVRRPEEILQHPTLPTVLEAGRPVALLLIGIVHHLRDDDAPYEVVRTLVDWLPSGSYLGVVSPSA